MKKILKSLKVIILAAIFISVCFCLGTILGGLIKGRSLTDTLGVIGGTSWLELAGVFLFSVVSAVIGGGLQVVVHELGHLVFGLLSGYRFLSFQVFGFVIVNEDSRLRVKRYNMAGALGQCLMLPPEHKGDDVPVVAYNAGGVVFNLILTLGCLLPMVLGNPSPLMAVFLGVTAFIGLYMMIMNGVPMCVSGLPNDGYNIFKLRGNPKSRRAFAGILSLTAMVKSGVRPRDLPAESFEGFDEVDFSEPLQVNMLSAYAVCLLDRGDYSRSEAIYRKIIEKETHVRFFILDAKCELACILYLSGRGDETRGLLDADDMKMVKMLSKTMSSKQRFLMFSALYGDGDLTTAESIYAQVMADKPNYLMQGETVMDLDMMSAALSEYKKR